MVLLLGGLGHSAWGTCLREEEEEETFRNAVQSKCKLNAMHCPPPALRETASSLATK